MPPFYFITAVLAFAQTVRLCTRQARRFILYQTCMGLACKLGSAQVGRDLLLSDGKWFALI